MAENVSKVRVMNGVGFHQNISSLFHLFTGKVMFNWLRFLLRQSSKKYFLIKFNTCIQKSASE